MPRCSNQDCICNQKIGVAVHCTVCGKQKKPVGRSAPLALAASLCDHECPGYADDPIVGHLWPNETQEEYGY
jgi:hypothetical protein